jgi:hypothetical protein
MRPTRLRVIAGATVLFLAIAELAGTTSCRAAVTREEVERAIRDGVRYLKKVQRDDGSWRDFSEKEKTGTTSLVTLALLTAGEKPSSPTIQKALQYLRKFGPDSLNSTYAISLQTMVYAAAEPDIDQPKISANVEWLERTQVRNSRSAGAWAYGDRPGGGDNSNSQYALLGLHSASEAGVRVKKETWDRARTYWEAAQRRDGGWSYRLDEPPSTASMTCAGISSLVICGLHPVEGQEYVENGIIHDCGKVAVNTRLNSGIGWLAKNFYVSQNWPSSQDWKFYYLYGLERVGRLTGLRFFSSQDAQHDWYREGAELLTRVQRPDVLEGFWQGAIFERDPLLATSFALLFLAKGRAPVLINKLAHGANLRGPDADWNRDPDDVRNLVGIVSREWNNLLTWQVVNPEYASVEDLLQAPILFFNGHKAPIFSKQAKARLRDYVDQGGFIFADACCGPAEKDFDAGFRTLMKEIFPEEEYKLRPLNEEHPVWRANPEKPLSPEAHPLEGIEHGCRTVVIYSPRDLSCYWNQAERNPTDPKVILSRKVGQAVIDYATGREMPADKLVVREVRGRAKPPRRDALRIAKLRHAGDWNIAPQAIPNLMDALSKPPYRFDVTVSQKEVFPRDPDLKYYPLVYIHGRASLSFDKEDLDALRQHIDPGAGTLFADAACGAPAFDASFRRFVAELFPDKPLVPIPQTDELFSDRVGTDLSKVQYTRAAGGGLGFPTLEGIKINDHWVVIYSKYDIGCALERHTGPECKGYNYESAVRIAGNIVIYSLLP